MYTNIKMISKSSLAVLLSKLKVFEKPKLHEEQYPTDSEFAAALIHELYMKNEITDKTIADFGAGTGLLGIAALFFAPKKIYFIEKDPAAFKTLKENIAFIEENYELQSEIVLLNEDIEKFTEEVDLVIQNPPFGTKTKHADKVFLEKAFNTADTVLSIHKTSTENFVRAISKDFKFDIIYTRKFMMPIKQVHDFHKKKLERIDVSAYFMKK